MNIRLANMSDETQLRKLVREMIVPGHIRMIYAREPNFFDGFLKTGDSTQIIIADDNDKIVGIGCRSIRNLFVNGESKPMGYLSGLKLADSIQNGLVLVRGYSFLKNLHADNKTPAYLTTIIQGNEHARQMLTSKRAGLPSYLPMGTYLTFVLPVPSKPSRDSASLEQNIEIGTKLPRDKVLAFLNQHGPRRQFFPACEGQGKNLLDLIGMGNLLVAQKGGQITGVLAIWNQEQYKQYIVAGYSGFFLAFRLCLNAVLRMKGYHPLPPAGNHLRYATAALVCIRDDDQYVFNHLIQCALNRAAQAGLHQLALGLHETDPLCLYMKDYFHIEYRSWLYLVCWENDSFYESLDSTKVPYLEIGTL